jgi:2-keto-4-pentenoate hydratase/2-oxohepta-3-ene-1,7-dioic acid hydratase in catechol pathway
VELGVVIGKGGSHIPPEDAYDHVMGYVIFLDITARDIQNELKEKHLPWAEAKGYDTFGPMSEMVPKESVPDPQNVPLRLWINNEIRQDGSTSLMIFKIDFLISYISNIMTLERGDIIATGTPKGVSQINPGDVLKAEIEGIGEVEFKVR